MTLGYAAPEVLSGDPSASQPPADLFSVGAVLFWMSFYPQELTVVTATEPVSEIPADCEAERRGLLTALFSEDPNGRPVAVLASFGSRVTVVHGCDRVFSVFVWRVFDCRACIVWVFDCQPRLYCVGVCSVLCGCCVGV
jgi:hypothetical protein